MKLRNPRLISIASCGIAWFVRGLLSTNHINYLHLGRPLIPKESGFVGGQFIYTFWHENILLPASRYGGLGVHVLISQHADGQLIGTAAERLGFHIVRGSSTRGGLQALRAMMKAARSHHIVITPDGPRGPRRQMQDGAIYLASRSGLPIVPVGIGYDRPWRAKSWDRFAIPKPFRCAALVTSDSISVPRNADRGTIEHYRQLVQQQIEHVTAIAESCASGASPGHQAKAA